MGAPILKPIVVLPNKVPIEKGTCDSEDDVGLNVTLLFPVAWGIGKPSKRLPVSPFVWRGGSRLFKEKFTGAGISILLITGSKQETDLWRMGLISIRPSRCLWRCPCLCPPKPKLLPKIPWTPPPLPLFFELLLRQPKVVLNLPSN